MSKNRQDDYFKTVNQILDLESRGHVIFPPTHVQSDLNTYNLSAMQSALPRKPKRNPETKLQRSIIAWLQAHGAVAIRVNSGAIKINKRFIRMNSASGCSDILACVPMDNLQEQIWDRYPDFVEHFPGFMRQLFSSVFVAIEVKTGTNKPSPHQSGFLERVQSAGGIAFVARSIADVERELSWLCK